MNKFIFKIGSLIATLALSFTSLNVNSACILYIHQPKLPEGAENLSKIN